MKGEGGPPREIREKLTDTFRADVSCGAGIPFLESPSAARMIASRFRMNRFFNGILTKSVPRNDV